MHRADDGLPCAVIANRLARGSHPAGNRRVGHRPPAKDRVHQFIFGHQPVTVIDQMPQQQEHLRLHRHTHPVPAQFEPVRVQREGAEMMIHGQIYRKNAGSAGFLHTICKHGTRDSG